VKPEIGYRTAVLPLLKRHDVDLGTAIVVNSRLSAEDLVARFARLGHARVEPPVLQPADIFLDQSGENFRRRMFVTTDSEGREMALRPEFTIPVVRLYLAGDDAGALAQYSYCGRVFRMQAGESGEFVQAGIESFGRTDTAATDAEIVALALEALNEFGVHDPDIHLGDMGLFNAVMEALALPDAVLRRLKRAFASGRLTVDTLDQVLGGQGQADASHAGLSAALVGLDPATARNLVEDMLKIARISTVGGRTSAEIADRFLRQAGQAEVTLPDKARAVLAAYLAISGEPDEVSDLLRALSVDEGLDLAAVLAVFDERTGFLAARGVDVSKIRVATAFGRDLDYYTGMVFEMRTSSESRSLVGGGRYDRLAQSLGATHPVPAVGCSIWMDRLIGSTP
jgi:ATP phosphoribosyltransferase regulatory subunit